MSIEKLYVRPEGHWDIDEASEAEILAQPCVVEALRKAYATDTKDVLSPWEDDPSEGGVGWVSGRRRLNLDGDEVAYAGHFADTPRCGVHRNRMPERDGGEAEADAWLTANGYVLL